MEQPTSSLWNQLTVLTAVVGITAVTVGIYSRSAMRPAEPPAKRAEAIEKRLPAIGELLETGKYDEARKMLRALAAVDEKNPTVQRLLGQACYAAGDYDGAAEVFARLIERNGLDSAAWNNLGQTRSRQKRYAEALPVLEKALKLTPESPQVMLNLGDVLTALDRKSEAESYYRKARAILNKQLGGSEPGEAGQP